MRKIIKVLVGVSLFATIFTPNIKIENTTNSSLIEYASDNFNKGKVDIKRLENVSNDTSYVVGSTMYVQMGENETSKFLRFATPIKGNPDKVEYIRKYDKDGTTDQKSKDVSILYLGIQSGEKDFYYNDEGLTETKPETIEYYWACYTIEFRGEKIINDYLTKDFTLELKVNDNKVELSRTSCLYANQSLISLKNDDDFNVFVDKSKKYDFAGKTISLDYERNVEITEVLYPDTSLKFNGTFDGKGNLGGIVGSIQANSSTIENCTNYMKISAELGYVGGIVGCSLKWTSIAITGCENRGSVESNAQYLGGIIGNAYCKVGSKKKDDILITNCINFKNVICKNETLDSFYLGGIAGSIANTTISSSCVEEHVEMTYGKTTKLITEFSMRYSGSAKPFAYIIAGKATTQAKGDNVIDSKSGICDANGTFLRTSGKGN